MEVSKSGIYVWQKGNYLYCTAFSETKFLALNHRLLTIGINLLSHLSNGAPQMNQFWQSLVPTTSLAYGISLSRQMMKP